jgi:hypothetical protein
MNTEFYKIATSLNEKLLSHAECYVKIHKSIRKFRRIFLSNLYFYVLSEDRVKFKIPNLKISKLFISINSSEFVLVSDSRSVLIDDLSIRDVLRKELLALNPDVDIVNVKDTLLDEYVEKAKDEEKEERLVLNLLQLRADFDDREEVASRKPFEELYSPEDCISKDEYCSVVTVGESRGKEEGRKKKKGEKEEARQFTAKIYSKKLIGQNQALLERILRERKYLEEVLSPYIPLLSRCFHSKTSIFCICDYYKGEPLARYLKNESLNRPNFRNLVAQTVIAIGQIHECNLVYNNVNLAGVFVTDTGYILLNELGSTREIAENYDFAQGKVAYKPPEASGEAKAAQSWDWYCLGQLIFEIKEGRPWKEEDAISWAKEAELCGLTRALLESDPSKRLGKISSR